MSKYRVRIQFVALAFILFPAAAGVLAVHASATCERFVRTYITKPVRNRVTRQTADAWAAWRVAHPNWKPNPNIHRPKYVMTREEAVQKVNFACSVEEVPTTIERFLQTTEVQPPPPVIDLAEMTPTQINLPDQIPPEVAEITPDNSWPSLGPLVPPVIGNSPPGVPIIPIIPPEVTPPGGLVPEPSTLLLSASGFAFLLLSLFNSRRKSA